MSHRRPHTGAVTREVYVRSRQRCERQCWRVAAKAVRHRGASAACRSRQRWMRGVFSWPPALSPDLPASIEPCVCILDFGRACWRSGTPCTPLVAHLSRPCGKRTGRATSPRRTCCTSSSPFQTPHAAAPPPAKRRKGCLPSRARRFGCVCGSVLCLCGLAVRVGR